VKEDASTLQEDRPTSWRLSSGCAAVQTFHYWQLNSRPNVEQPTGECDVNNNSVDISSIRLKTLLFRLSYIRIMPYNGRKFLGGFVVALR